MPRIVSRAGSHPIRRLLWLFWLAVVFIGGVAFSITGLAAQSASSKLKLDTGEEIYKAGCVACHGADGRGTPQAIAGFEPPPTFPDFTDCPTSTVEPDIQWRAIVGNGGPARAFSPIMPSFQDFLTPEQIGKVIAYLRSLCTERAWPLGNMNLPRPIFTEKAFPENEAVVAGAANVRGSPGGNVTSIYERRIGPSGMVEFSVPFEFTHDPTGTHSAFGDIALGYKRKLWSSAPKGMIWSAGGEISAPTGNRAIGAGGESTVFEFFTAFARLLPAAGFVQLHSGIELPVHPSVVPRAYYLRSAVGKTVASEAGLGRRWSPMAEIIFDRELAEGAANNLDLIPQLQVPLSKRMHILANFGVRVPANNRPGRPTQFVFYFLWDYVDGGLTDGWK